MKRLYIAIAFLVVLSSLCIYEQILVRQVYTGVTGYIDEAMQAFNNEEYDKTEKICLELTSYWEKKHKLMTALIEHGELDTTSVMINALSDLSENKKDELEKELIDIKNEMNIIYENQRISFGNIF